MVIKWGNVFSKGILVLCLTAVVACQTDSKSIPATSSTVNNSTVVSSSTAASTTVVVSTATQLSIAGSLSTFSENLCIPFSVTAKDSNGKPAAVAQNTQVAFSFIAGGANTALYSDSACANVATGIRILAGKSSQIFFMKATGASGVSKLRVTDQTSSLANNDFSFQIIAPPVSTLTLTNPVNAKTGDCTAIPVNTDVAVIGFPMTVNFSSNSVTGLFYGSADCTSVGTATYNASIAVGQTTATVYFRNTLVESLALAAQSGSIIGTNSFSIIPNTNVQYFFSGANTDVATAGYCKSYTITRADSFGNATSTGTPTVTIDAKVAGVHNGNFYSDTSCSAGAALNLSKAYSLAAGQTTFSFSYMPLTISNNIVLSALGTDTFTGGRILQTVGQPTQLVLSGTSPVSAGSCTPMSVTVEDAVPEPVPGKMRSVTITGLGTNGQIYPNATACASLALLVGPLVISSGASSSNFYFRDTLAGDNVSLVATTPGLTNGTFPITVNPGPPAKFGFSPTTSNPSAGQCTGAINVVVNDAFGNTVKTGADSAVTLSKAIVAGTGSSVTNVSTAYFTTDCTDSLSSSLIIRSGDISTGFSFKDTASQQVQITASGTVSSVNISGTTTINVKPGTPTDPVFLGSSSIDLNTCIPYSISIADVYGNPAPYSTTKSLALNESPTSGEFYDNSTACVTGGVSSQIHSVTFHANIDTSTTVYFKVQDLSTAASVYSIGVPGGATSSTTVHAGRVVTSIAAGRAHMCAVESGAVFCWGDNSSGQLGNGTMGNVSIPTKVSTSALLNNVEKVFVGGNNTCALTQGGAYCWGDNSSGQVGIDSTASLFSTPQLLGTANIPAGISSMSLGGSHVLAISNGEAYGWGNNLRGQLGNGTTTSINYPIPAIDNSSSPFVSGVSEVSAGYEHSCGIAKGAAYCWGDDSSGQVGRYITASGYYTFSGTDATTAINVIRNLDPTPGDIQTTGYIGSGAGKDFSCFLEKSSLRNGGEGSDTLVCTGNNFKKQLGESGAPATPAIGAKTYNNFLVSVQNKASSSALLGVNSFQLGDQHGIALSGGKVYGWGRGDAIDGRLGSFLTNLDQATSIIPDYWSSNVLGIVAGGSHSCALTNGEWKCVGLNSSGQLGTNSTSNYFVPSRITGMVRSLLGLAGGGAHSCALLDGGVQCWGGNSYGQLGNLNTISSIVPKRVFGATSSGFLLGANKIVNGDAHACAYVNGDVLCWGANSNGQLGNSSTNNSSVPQSIGTSRAYFCGTTKGYTAELYDACMGIVATPPCATMMCGGGACDTAWKSGCTGFNCSIYGIVFQIANQTSCNNGKVWAGTTWANAHNDGLNWVSGSHSLALVNGVDSLSSYFQHTCAVSAGKVYCWGSNTSGQTVSGSIATAVQAPTLAVTTPADGFRSVAAGGAHTCALKDGNAYCWGDITHGQVGIDIGTSFGGILPDAGTLITKVHEVADAGTTGPIGSLTEITAGLYHTCVIQNGGVKCWGANNNGQLGNSSEVQSSVPVTVVGAAENGLPIKGVTAITAGDGHTCAIQNGNAVCWGNDGYNAFGTEASQVLTGGGVTHIAAGRNHTCAVQNGHVFCWGENSSGQLGNGVPSRGVYSTGTIPPLGLWE